MSLAFSDYYWCELMLEPLSNYRNTLKVISEPSLKQGTTAAVRVTLIGDSLPEGVPFLARLGELRAVKTSRQEEMIELCFALPDNFALGLQSLCLVFHSGEEGVWQIFREENCLTILQAEEDKQ